MKNVLIVMLLLSVGLSFDLTDYNCDNTTGRWTCQKPATINDAHGILLDNVVCFSETGWDYPELGCLAAIQLDKPKVIESCKYTVLNDTISYGPCENKTLDKGYGFLGSIDPSLLDLSKCSKYMNETLYVTECYLSGKEVSFSGAITGEGMYEVVFINALEIPQDKTVRMLVDNIVYIILIIVVILVAYWVFAPHKPMLKERKVQSIETKIREEKIEEAPGEKLTKREKRYGRKL